MRAWVVDYGWHTEIVVPAAQIEGPLAEFRTMFPNAETLSFGFGKQSFFTLVDPGFTDFLEGAVPGPGAVRVIPLTAEPARLYTSPVTQLPLTPAEWTALSGFLWRSVKHGPDGAPIPVPGNDNTGGRFFAATPGYSLAYTCNTWTVDALHQSGFPVGGLVVRANGAMREVASIRTACAATRDLGPQQQTE